MQGTLRALGTQASLPTGFQAWTCAHSSPSLAVSSVNPEPILESLWRPWEIVPHFGGGVNFL